jgi:hypothetical protein
MSSFVFLIVMMLVFAGAKYWREVLKVVQFALGLFGNASDSGLQRESNADVTLVKKYLANQLSSDAGVTAAGRRLSPTGKWVCMRCGANWNADGEVPAQWWTPVNNSLSSKEYRDMKDTDLPPWHCRQGLCGSYAYSIPVP